MNKNNSKIGYSDIGGIFIGKNIQSDFHKHHFISIHLSFGETFEITKKGESPQFLNAIIIQKDISYRLNCIDYVIFIHIDPYSEIGLDLTQKNNKLQELNIDLFSEAIIDIKSWFESTENDEKTTKEIINNVSKIARTTNPEKRTIDQRIKQSMQIIKDSNEEKISIKQIAKSVNLSTSHFARLFKKETGIAFRKFVLHHKLVKSLMAMKEKNLTESSFVGGFSDQAHFTRTFKHSFGIKPSKSKK
jgi:AraC-like DNA-binding protein